MKVLVYDFVLLLPSRSQPDVCTRELTAKIGDAQYPAIPLQGSDIESLAFEGKLGESVTGAMVDITVDGSRLPEIPFAFAITAATQPAGPSGIGLKVFGSHEIEV